MGNKWSNHGGSAVLTGPGTGPWTGLSHSLNKICSGLKYIRMLKVMFLPVQCVPTTKPVTNLPVVLFKDCLSLNICGLILPWIFLLDYHHLSVSPPSYNQPLLRTLPPHPSWLASIFPWDSCFSSSWNPLWNPVRKGLAIYLLSLEGFQQTSCSSPLLDSCCFVYKTALGPKNYKPTCQFLSCVATIRGREIVTTVDLSLFKNKW